MLTIIKRYRLWCDSIFSERLRVKLKYLPLFYLLTVLDHSTTVVLRDIVLNINRVGILF